MSAFENSKLVEAEALARLQPYLIERSGTAENPGRFILNEKGPLAKNLQETVGDVLLTHRDTQRLVSIEIKAERKHTGNAFIECWSNLNLSDQESWEARGSNPGWAWKLYPGLLFYYFLDADTLYIIKGYKLWQWMHLTRSQGTSIGATRIHDFRRVCQKASAQLNDTWGHLVPLSVLAAEVGIQVVHLNSIEGVAA